MKLFNVYSLFDIEPVRGEGAYLWDAAGNRYLDLYGGHAVISIGHGHPHFKERLKEQIDRLVFYSNSVQNTLQHELAAKLGLLSGYEDYHLFLCNSGAEANENALKLASFHTQKSKVIAFEKGFHGRTSAAIAATDNPRLVAPLNAGHDVAHLAWGDVEQVEAHLKKGDVCAVIIEGIQGVGGVLIPDRGFLEALGRLCAAYEALLILDEIQSGYGRSGKFFAHQYSEIRPDIISMAKGMGNGFPIGGILIHPRLEPWPGMLGTTFGGNHLACAAGLAVVEVLREEELLENARKIGGYLKEELQNISSSLKELRALGLMMGLEFDFEIKTLRQKLLYENYIFTGISGSNTLRLLPPLNLTQEQAAHFVEKLQSLLKA